MASSVGDVDWLKEGTEGPRGSWVTECSVSGKGINEVLERISSIRGEKEIGLGVLEVHVVIALNA